MPTIKQIEAFYWSGQLGSFVAAASRLNTTQSNISKRIQELEYTLSVELFDRGRRAIKLTAKGEEMMRLSADLMRIHLQLGQIGKSALTISGPFRFGVTEAVALTWLSRLSTAIHTSFEGLVPIATVDTSANLNTLLLERKIDLAIATDRSLDASLLFRPLVHAERIWVASPELIDHDRPLSIRELALIPMLGHGADSINHTHIARYFKDNGLFPKIVASCTSISALLRMALDGMGITYLHRDVVAGDVRAGRLKVIPTALEIRPLLYVAAYRDDVISPVAELVAQKAVEVCDFAARKTLAEGRER